MPQPDLVTVLQAGSKLLGHRRATCKCEVWSVQHLHLEGSGTKPLSGRDKRAGRRPQCVGGVGSAQGGSPAELGLRGRHGTSFSGCLVGSSHTDTSDQPRSRDQREGGKTEQKTKPPPPTRSKNQGDNPFFPTTSLQRPLLTAVHITGETLLETCRLLQGRYGGMNLDPTFKKLIAGTSCDLFWPTGC